MHIPSKIQLHKQSKTLELHFDGQTYTLSAEFLRVHSPSAEVKGHGPGQEVLQYGKKNVGINVLEMAGNYAIRIQFDDQHDSGIFTWDYLYQLCTNEEKMWQDYLQKLHDENQHRDPEVNVVSLFDPGKNND